jgi:hypothetical protein
MSSGIATGLMVLLHSTFAAGPSATNEWPVVELRQYTLRPGQRDVLIELFEREFIESQETLGMKILGTFRDLDNPNRFVWLRGFSSMTARAEALEAFYGGPVWQTHRNAANATMLDSGNVLLLRVARAGAGFSPIDRARAPKGASHTPSGLVVATIYYFDRAVEPEFIEFFEMSVKPELKAAGVPVRAAFVTETTKNNFPALPVRENERVFVWFSVFPDAAGYNQSLEGLKQSAAWRTIGRTLQQKLKAQPEVLRLEPTPRSELHYQPS